MSQVIRDFRSTGYEVWMDDFGSGYSSLTLLKDFDFDLYCEYIDKEYSYLEHLQDALLLVNVMNGPVDLILLIKPKIAKLKMKH